MNEKTFFVFLSFCISSVFLIASTVEGDVTGTISWLLVLLCILIVIVYMSKNKSQKQSNVTTPLIKNISEHDIGWQYNLSVRAVKTPILGSIIEKFSSQVSKIGPSTGLQVDPATITSRVIPVYVICSGGIITISLLLGVLFSPLYFLLSISPLFLPVLPAIYYGQYVSQRKQNTEHDLPFFFQFIETLNYVGILLPDALKMIKKSNVFSGIIPEAKLFLHLVKMGGMSETTAITRISNTHPNINLTDFLSMYVANLKTNSESLERHIHDTAHDSYENLKFQIKSKRNTIGPLFIMMSSAAFVGPLFITVIIKLPAVPTEMLLLVINFMPFAMMFIVMSVGTVKAFTGDKLPVYPHVFLLGIPVFVFFYVISDVYTAVGFAVSAATFANWILVRQKDSSISHIEKDISASINLIGEKTSIKVSINKIISDISKEKAFSPAFRKIFSNILTELRTRQNPMDAFCKNDTPSYMMKMTLFALYSVYVSGNVNATALKKFADMMKNAVKAKSQFRSTMLMNSVVMLISPISILMTFLLMMSLFDSMPVNGIPGMPELKIVDNDIIADGLKPTVLFFGICSGIIVSIIALFSIRRMLPIAIGSAVSGLTLFFWDYFVDMSDGMQILSF